LAAERDLHALGLKCSKYFDFFKVPKYRQSLVECLLAYSEGFFVITKYTHELLKASIFFPYELAIVIVYTVLYSYTREPTKCAKKNLHILSNTLHYLLVCHIGEQGQFPWQRAKRLWLSLPKTHPRNSNMADQ